MVFGGMLVRYSVPFFNLIGIMLEGNNFAKYIYSAFLLLSHDKTCFIRKLYNLIRAFVGGF